MLTNFITNAKEKTLKNRIKTLIRHSEELKFLVGFFYFSGWNELYEEIKNKENIKLKILVGLDTDIYLNRVIEVETPDSESLSISELIERFFKSLKYALNDEHLDTKEFYEQAEFFLKLLEEGRLEIRKTLEPNHAKLYLFRLEKETQEVVNAPGRFITGSSNFTRAGLTSQREFNVEIGDYGWEDAEKYFDDLWEDAIPITEEPNLKEKIIKIIKRQTQLATITPFEAYALVLKTYLDMMEQRKLKPSIKEIMIKRGYKIYRYQEEAVEQALSVISKYGGVILADVVGLGKSVIASWIAREKGDRGIVICPPALIGDEDTKSTGWYKYLNDFQLYDWEVFSTGKLDKALEYIATYGDDIKTVIVDEAHRFRNEDTEAYEKLSQICTNRDVILLTATPFNNSPSDIFSLLRLFVPPGKSTLTLDEKLRARFSRYTIEFRKLSYILRYQNSSSSEKRKRVEKYYRDIFGKEPPVDLKKVKQRIHQIAKEIKSIIEPVVIRRNRLDLKNDPIYKDEVTELSNIADPVELFYKLTPEQSQFYDSVIRDYFGENPRFKGAIYQPYLYERGYSEEIEEEFTYTQQRNLYDFMRRLLVKRFESSFHAFYKSLENFAEIHKKVLVFVEKTGKYILDRKLIEKIYEEDEDVIEEYLREFAEKLDEKMRVLPKHDRIYELDKFKRKEEFISDIKNDLKLFEELKEKVKELRLIEDDPKVRKLVEAIEEILENHSEKEPIRKVVVFTEYLDTLYYVAKTLEKHFPNRVLKSGKTTTSGFMKILNENFDASYSPDKQRNDYDILVATDRLSEGVNLNRAGAVINYDIPWNPTKVIQRVGRINRIGKKVFDTLYIYNFFPTEQGAEVVKSREIAAQKMFLIHNALGEDSKIFSPDEQPTPSELFSRINRNPEEFEEESLLTIVRKEFFNMKEKYPEIIERLSDFPLRVKTAKKFDKNELIVFRKKGLQLFIHMVEDTTADKIEVKAISFDEALNHIKAHRETPNIPLSENFWRSYEAIKNYRERSEVPRSEQSILARAENNLKSALKYHREELEEFADFIRMLLKDIKEYQILPKYTLRRLAKVEMRPNASKNDIDRFKNELRNLMNALGKDYLIQIEKRISRFKSEIVIAVENINA